ncbi:MAG: putative YhdH/YhfP family quinone oxidoreductase [Candidatus Aldehydirespiratoraceae bacterium]|jgi:putative YhdH/YhfP family quinone oxidoreductase
MGQIAEPHHLSRMLAPDSVALVGASTMPNVAGNDMVLELQVSRFDGTVYPVNPKYREVEGYRCFPSLRDLPTVPDLAVLSVGNSALEEQVDAAIEIGVGGLVIPGSAVHPDDTVKSRLRNRIQAKASEANLPIVGANCMGFYNVEAWFRAFPFHRPYELKEGGVTLISQSGSVLSALLWNDQKLRFNLAVSPGQELVTTTAEYMDYALHQETTRVIALFLESIRRPDAFVAALELAAERDVPVVALKTGRSEQSTSLALSHSGAITGDDAAYQALFRKYGVASVSSLDELASTALLLSNERRTRAGGVAAILDSGGERELLIDIAEDHGVDFAAIEPATVQVLEDNLDHGLEPMNPLDAWGTGRNYQMIYERCWQALMDDADTAIGVFVADLTSGFYLHESFARVCRRVHRRSTKPMAVLTNHVGTDSQDLALRLTGLGIPVLDGTVTGVQAIRHAFDYRDHQALITEEPTPPPAAAVTDRWRSRLTEPTPLSEAEGLAMLADYGVPTMPVGLASSAATAVTAANSAGYPVVLKTAEAGILHKSDVGGVKLDLADDTALRSAYEEMAGRLGRNVLIAPMAKSGVELALGIVVDPQFGPMVLVAGGGIFIEVLGDRALSLTPVGAHEARRLIDRLAIRPVLDGIRGKPRLDIDAVVDAIVALSSLAEDLGDLIGEFDINPLVVHPKGCVALDALVIPAAVHRANEESQMNMSTPFNALVVREGDEAPRVAIEELVEDDLPTGDVLVDVDYSSLNYKDGMALTGEGRIIRKFPMVPGIDLVGTVRESESERFAVGDDVILTGWGVGERYWGGYTQRQRVRSDWLVHRPDAISPVDSMAIGTAGLTSMLCVMALEAGGVTPERGPIVVTGAAGGVGSVAVALLANLGYEVAAVTGRAAQHDYLRSLGASTLLSRGEMTAEARPLEAETWAGGIDTVGSTMLAKVLAQTKYDGAVAACGLAGGVDLPTSVMPFILRGVRLQGIDSVMAPLAVREAAWARLATDLPRDLLDSIVEIVPMSQLLGQAQAILDGQVRGRLVVDPNR